MSEAAPPSAKNYTPPAPELGPGQTSYTSITEKISGVVLTRETPIPWFLAALVGFILVGLLQVAIAYLLYEGVGIWGINIPIGWGFAIINFVWWIGIGHAGTLISAILLLFRQKWRTSINRSAEAMTIFAVMCAGMFPLIHTGRPWLAAYWLFPYPNSMDIWPQFRSPLIWDVFAVGTYLTISLLFWILGMIPDFATFRDRAKHRVSQVFFGMLSMGWRGSAIHWERYEMASLMLAGLSTPLVLSVHSIVSLDFAVSIIPGWHTTIFSALFRRRRNLRRFCHGPNVDDPPATAVRLGGLHHRSTPRQHGQSDACCRADSGLRVLHGATDRVVQRQCVRGLHDGKPHVRAVRSLLLAADSCATSRYLSCCGRNGSASAPCGSSSCRCSSMSECGWSASSSSSSASIAGTCPLPGTCTIRRSGTGRPMPAQSASSCLPSACSSACGP